MLAAFLKKDQKSIEIYSLFFHFASVSSKSKGENQKDLYHLL